MAVFGSRRLLHKLSIAGGERRAQLKKEWRERRSSHFFSVGQANQRGNGNTRLLCEDGKFSLEIRNWFDGDDGDFRVPLHVPDYCKDMLKGLISKAEAVRLDQHGALVGGGMAYSVRVIRCEEGYQVLISFELDERNVGWNGGRVAGIDINPEGIACTVVSKDGNLIATRFFRDNRLISASKSNRKWVLENLINRMLRWCSRAHGCNAITLEGLKLKGAYDYGSRTNYKLSHFMRRRMIEVIKLHAFKMNVVTVEVNPAYLSMVATIKYRKQFGGFNRHHLAAFVIARRALGYGEVPALSCLPGKKEKEKRM